jgi:hypothetical protein
MPTGVQALSGWPRGRVEEDVVYRRSPRADAQRISQVLAGITFPAAKWQLIMHAEDYGADAATRAELWSLPAMTYADLPDVLAALGLVGAPRRPAGGHRRPTAGQARPRAGAATPR